MTKVHPELVAIFRRLVSGQGRWPLLLFGPAGTGKTFASLALCDFACTAGRWTAESLADLQVAGTLDWEPIRTKGLAVLDELGERERVADLHCTVVKKFIDAREAHAQRVALYVSNLPPAGIAQTYGDRIASRVLCGTIFELSGQDRRRAE